MRKLELRLRLRSRLSANHPDKDSVLAVLEDLDGLCHVERGHDSEVHSVYGVPDGPFQVLDSFNDGAVCAERARVNAAAVGEKVLVVR